jgi:hypothetical protein
MTNACHLHRLRWCAHYVLAPGALASWVKPTILVLLALSAASDGLGTFTVARSYLRSARAAQRLEAAMIPSAPGAEHVASYMATSMTPGLILDQLRGDGWALAGIVALGAAAAFGFAAGVVSLFYL